MFSYRTIFIIVLLLSFSFTYYLYKCINKREYEKFDNYHNVKFLTKIDTAKFLLEDPDKYVSNMSDIDLYARKVNDRNEYINKISLNAMDFNIDEKEKILKCTKIADSFLRNYNDLLDGNKIAKINWKFSLISNKNGNNIEYEEGLPHTRHDIIFLSKYVLNNNIDDLTNILIHEKVHIYQRYNEKEMEIIIKNMGYMISKKQINTRLKRSNPDINNVIYINPDNNKDMLGLYRNEKPNGIGDTIITDFAIEHPYEKIAYEIANEYNKTHINKYKSNNI